MPIEHLLRVSYCSAVALPRCPTLARSCRRPWATVAEAPGHPLRTAVGSRSADQGGTPGLAPTSPLALLALLAQEVLDLLHQLRRGRNVCLERGLRRATRRVIVLL
jgi:hypothetical protein